MLPEININYIAIIVCVVVGMPVGFLWYGPLFGKAWARHVGLENMEKPSEPAMLKSMALYAFGSLLIAFVLAHSVEVWRPSSWKAGDDLAPWEYGWPSAFFTWVGFFLPIQMGRVAWEQKSWGLVAINAGFDLVRLTLFGMILAYL